MIIESFATAFNKIKRLDESELNEDNDGHLGKWVPPTPEQSTFIDKFVKDSGDKEEARVNTARAERLKKQSETLGKSIKGESELNESGSQVINNMNDSLTNLYDSNQEKYRSLNKELDGYVFGKEQESRDNQTVETQYTFKEFGLLSGGKEWGVTFWTSTLYDGKKGMSGDRKNFLALDKFSDEHIKNLGVRIREILQ